MKLSIRLTDQQKSSIAKLADAEGLTISEWVRRVIERVLENPVESFSELATAETLALLETRFLMRLMIGHANPSHADEWIEQAKKAAQALRQKKLA